MRHLRRIGFSKDASSKTSDHAATRERERLSPAYTSSRQHIEARRSCPFAKIRKHRLTNPFVCRCRHAQSGQSECPRPGEVSIHCSARIRNEIAAMQRTNTPAMPHLANAQSVVFEKKNGHRLIVTYSEAPGEKRISTTVNGLRRLRKRVASAAWPKKHINNRATISSSNSKPKSVWKSTSKKYCRISAGTAEGLPDQHELVVRRSHGHYGQLWHIERAFRISKSDLRVRPIFHRSAPTHRGTYPHSAL